MNELESTEASKSGIWRSQIPVAGDRALPIPKTDMHITAIGRPDFILFADREPISAPVGHYSPRSSTFWRKYPIEPLF